MEALGKTRVRVRDGRVVEVSQPLIEYCPLFHKYRGIEKSHPRLFVRILNFALKILACAPGIVN